ncbi:E3 ubiquitin-protein ligase ATL31-like [Curcuma longa]|uniref:E3 ubiquitin-protein ligase ATL31-like n=1 Tax=Curcuma longa TaxID=136217 RepID=UPI003D9E9D23
MATGMVALLFLLVLNVRCSDAQVASDNRNDNYRYYDGRFSPTMAVVVVVIAATFFFFALFAIYVRRCSGGDDFASTFFRGAAGGEGGESLSRGLGLSSEAMEKLPIVRYAEAKGMKGGPLPMDCAVCLSEFVDDDELVRLLPRCGHLFHADCITAWFASHATCPVCRDNVAQLPDETTTAGASQDHVAIVAGEAEEAVELERLGRQRQEARSSSGRMPPTWFQLSHSTSHSVTVRPTPDMDIYLFVMAETNQWPSVFLRSLSTSLPALAARRSEVEEGESSRGGRSAATLDDGSSSTSLPPSQA